MSILPHNEAWHPLKGAFHTINTKSILLFSVILQYQWLFSFRDKYIHSSHGHNLQWKEINRKRYIILWHALAPSIISILSISHVVVANESLFPISRLCTSTCRQASDIRRNLSRQWNCWSLRCSWSIACRRCSNYIFILNWTHGFNGLGKDNCKSRRESFKCWNLLRLTLEVLLYIW